MQTGGWFLGRTPFTDSPELASGRLVPGVARLTLAHRENQSFPTSTHDLRPAIASTTSALPTFVLQSLPVGVGHRKAFQGLALHCRPALWALTCRLLPDPIVRRGGKPFHSTSPPPYPARRRPSAYPLRFILAPRFPTSRALSARGWCTRMAPPIPTIRGWRFRHSKRDAIVQDEISLESLGVGYSPVINISLTSSIQIFPNTRCIEQFFAGENCGGRG